ncbi:hypothetical protein BHM03_00059264 [Ensete ventricosum]|nr:hypothetical protein BHM03_00059264 [Ensete ventricosum]
MRGVRHCACNIPFLSRASYGIAVKQQRVSIASGRISPLLFCEAIAGRSLFSRQNIASLSASHVAKYVADLIALSERRHREGFGHIAARPIAIFFLYCSSVALSHRCLPCRAS